VEKVQHVLNALLGAYIVKIGGEVVDVYDLFLVILLLLLFLLLLFFIQDVLIEENILITKNVLFGEADIFFDATSSSSFSLIFNKVALYKTFFFKQMFKIYFKHQIKLNMLF